MTTTVATLPDQLTLHDGEEFALQAVARGGMLVVTKPSFAEKWGASMAKVEDPDDAWLSRINGKHVK